MSPRRLPAPGTWEPILTGADAEQARVIIAAIAEELRSPRPPHTGGDEYRVPLWSGAAGLMLLYAYLDRAAPGSGHAEALATYVDEVFQYGPLLSHLTPFPFGFTGVGFALEHVRGWLGEDADPCAALDEDVAYATTRLRRLEHRDHTFRTGLSGHAVYALERLPVPAAIDLLADIVTALAECAERDDAGARWRLWGDTDAHTHSVLVGQERFPRGLVPLDAASGALGPMAALAGACANGVARPVAAPLLRDALRWYASRPWPARLPCDDWEGGYVGHAGVLLAMATALGSEECLGLALQQGGRACAAAGELADASLSHGTAGRAHVFNRLYQATREPRFSAAARAEFARTLEMRRPERGIGGYQMFVPERDSALRPGSPIGHLDLPGVFLGAGGVALALLAATTDVEPAWDRAMLLSLRSPAGTAPPPLAKETVR
jgi:hypothetical protein